MKPPAKLTSGSYIIIVEDDATTLSVYRNILESIGGEFSIKCFSDARKALYFLENELKNSTALFAILLDLHMPYLDGWQFLDIIHQIEYFSSFPPLIWLCSADSSTYTFKQIIKQAYVDRFLQKPIEWDQLKEFSDKALELKSKHYRGNSVPKCTHNSLSHLMKYSIRFSNYLKMEKRPIAQIILNVRSKLELEKQIYIHLHKYEDPIYQALILSDFFHTIENFILRVTVSDDPKKEALLRILSTYLELIDSLWVKEKLHRNHRTKSHFEKYCSEYELLEFRFLKND
ncbi:MAG: response regulator [Bacteroidota bacterium]